MSNDTLAASCAQAAKDAVRFQDERDQLAAENARLRVEVERLTAAPPPAAARVDVTWPLSILEAGNWREVYMGTKHMRLAVSYPYEAWERLMAALAAAQQQQQQQPAEGEDIMVNTPYDVFILPLRPSGLSSGPRFVVHVPGPEQPAADQFIATFRCEDNGIVGVTDAKIHSVTRHDDGVIEVVIDHWPKQPAEQHPDDAAVDHFAAAMKAKLKKKRQEGRGGWQSMTSKQLSALLHEHVRKGDPVDVANLAMMLHQNGQVIEPPATTKTDEMIKELRDALKELISWIPSADIYKRMGFNPEAPMRAFKRANDLLSKVNNND